jgi:hypothetical protein
VDVHTDLFSHEEDAFACSDRMLTVEVIIINDSSTRSAGDAGWEQYFGQKIKYKGKIVRALKDFSLKSLGKHLEIPSNLYMNGLISSVPWLGHQEYRIVWDTSVLPIAL